VLAECLGFGFLEVDQQTAATTANETTEAAMIKVVGIGSGC
jgi:hypothetical protein